MDFNIDLSQKLSLKYPNRVPKDYDVSEIQYTFDFIYMVLKNDAGIEEALKSVSYKYNLSEVHFKKYLIENKYVLTKGNANDASVELKRYNTKSLKKMLKKNGLKASGKRQQIEKRIIESGLLGSEEYLSSKSKIFYKNKKRRIRIFEQLLYKYYYFNEFNEFYMDNFRKKEEKIPIAFINRHIDKATEDEDHYMFAVNSQVMVEHFYERGNFKGMMEHVLKILCINLNPVWKTDDLKNHGGIPIETYNNLLLLKGRLGKNRIISAYFVVWDSFNFEKIIVSKYAGYRCLKDLLNYKDYNKINDELYTKYYSNDDLKIKKITQKTLFDF
ncbi:SAP domain-containing protein [uncultured Methanobrevibacter sp.]|uniref:SAP domain-containing protein n=1 Tax=uncultured Methanobrevibacter sp. TaxID=253161 RepID=UPI0026385DBA|nr:SAP domain-containing protein [uncultured Methanobrevibacter sp.]